MEGYWVSYMVLPPAAGALPSAGLDGAAAADVGATVLVLPPAAGALPSAGLDGAAAADVGATVLVAVAPAHPAAASSPHVPIASATRCLVMFMSPLRHTTPAFSRWFADAERQGLPLVVAHHCPSVNRAIFCSQSASSAARRAPRWPPVGVGCSPPDRTRSRRPCRACRAAGLPAVAGVARASTVGTQPCSC